MNFKKFLNSERYIRKMKQVLERQKIKRRNGRKRFVIAWLYFYFIYNLYYTRVYK